MENRTTGVDHEFRRIVCACCGKTKDVPVYCGDRFCPVCSGPRRRRLQDRFHHLVKATPLHRGYRWRFITLTIPTHLDPEPALDVLYASFRKLRSRKFWKSNVDGGFAGAEVTRSNGKWHVHIHIVAYARYIPQAHLVKIWRQVSPGRICDIRLLPETTAISYICKYITKQALPESDRAVAGKALSSRRMYTAFGICHAIKCPATKLHYACPNCGGTDWSLLSLIGTGVGYEVDCIADGP